MEILPAVLQPLSDFITMIGGPAAGELGQMFGDNVRVWRLKNQVRLFEKAKSILDAEGVEPSAVPLRTLLPLLEGASLEDDGMLSDKWAGLLSAAANPHRTEAVLPSYPHILKSLSPTDVQLLDLMYSNGQIGGTVIGTDGQEIDRGWTLKSEIFDKLEISNEDIFSISVENLVGFGIVEVGGRGFGGSKMEFNDKREVGLTALGTAFVKACSS